MADTIYGTPLDNAKRPDLLKYCIEELGHKLGYLQAMGYSVEQLKALVREDKRYVPSAHGTHGETVPAAAQAPTQPASVPPMQVPQVAGGSLEAMLANTVAPMIAPMVAAQVTADLRQEIAAIRENQPRELRMTLNLGEMERKISADLRHEVFPTVFRTAVAKVPLYLHGPAGTGKTTIGFQLAKAIGEAHGIDVASFHQSFGPASQLHELLGIPAINGHPAQRTPLWDAWEQPSVIVLDELDAAPELFVQLNAGLANGYIVFADGVRHKKHEHCYIVAAGNTIMAGATMTYTSRGRQDKATVDRFAFLAVGYDEKLELAAAGDGAVKWVKHVQRLRKAHAGLGASAPDLLITPRASILGAQVLRVDATVTFPELESMFIWRGASEDEIAKVRKAAKL